MRMRLKKKRGWYQTSDSAWTERNNITNSFSRTFFRRAKPDAPPKFATFEAVGDYITIHVCGEGDDCRETCHVERLYRRTDIELRVCPNCVYHRTAE